MQLRFCDLSRQVANLPANMALLIGMYRSKLVQLSDLGIDLDLFDYGRIADAIALISAYVRAPLSRSSAERTDVSPRIT